MLGSRGELFVEGEVFQVDPPGLSSELCLQDRDLVLYLSPLRVARRIVRFQKLEHSVVPLRDMCLKKPSQHFNEGTTAEYCVYAAISRAQFDKRPRLLGKRGTHFELLLVGDVVVRLSVL